MTIVNFLNYEFIFQYFLLFAKKNCISIQKEFSTVRIRELTVWQMETPSISQPPLPLSLLFNFSSTARTQNKEATSPTNHSLKKVGSTPHTKKASQYPGSCTKKKLKYIHWLQKALTKYKYRIKMTEQKLHKTTATTATKKPSLCGTFKPKQKVCQLHKKPSSVDTEAQRKNARKQNVEYNVRAFNRNLTIKPGLGLAVGGTTAQLGRLTVHHH